MKLFFTSCVLCVLCSYAGSMQAATTATVQFVYTLTPIDTMTVSGNPAPMIINTASAGSLPTSCSDCTTTFAVTTNGCSRSISGQLAYEMPTGMTLYVALTAPTGATSLGNVAMTTAPQNLVTSIANLAQGSLGIMYTLMADARAAPVVNAPNTLTLTVGP